MSILTDEEWLELEGTYKDELRDMIVALRAQVEDLAAERDDARASRMKLIDNLVMIAAEIGAPAPADYDRVIKRVRALRGLEKAASSLITEGFDAFAEAFLACADALESDAPSPKFEIAAPPATEPDGVPQ